MKMLLTRKVRMFCRAYIINFNATDAGLYAGYKSRDTARSQGSKLLKRPEVKAYVDHLVARRTKRLDVTADKVIAEYAKIAFLDVATFYDSEGHLLPFSKMSPENRGAVASLTYDNNFAPVIKTHDKLKALDSLSKHLGLYEKDNKQTKSDDTIEAKEPDF